MIKYRRQKYNVKRNLFKNMTFAIREDTLPEVSKEVATIVTSYGEFESRDAMIEYMARTIIENAGRVVQDTHGS